MQLSQTIWYWEAKISKKVDESKRAILSYSAKGITELKFDADNTFDSRLISNENCASSC